MINVNAEYVKVEFPCTTTVPAGTEWRPTSKDVRVVDDAQLATDEVGELVAVEIYNPNRQDIRAIWTYIDETWEAKEVFWASGVWETQMLPPRQHSLTNHIISLGKPGSRNLIQNTTLKFRRTCIPRVLAGAAITLPFTVVMHYFVYKRDALPRIWGALDGVVSIEDRARNRLLNLDRGDLVGRIVTDALWDSLPGGRTQVVPKVYPIVRYAVNEKVIGVEADYTFDKRFAEVEHIENNLWFIPDDRVIMMFEGLGCRTTSANSHYTAIRIDGDYRPGTKVFTKPNHNDIHFGHVHPLYPIDQPQFFIVPKLAEPVVIFASDSLMVPDAYREKGGVIHRATTAVAPIRSVTVAVTGKRIET